ncbi:hypothetical protein AKJ16_DCAP04624 [Drosera capensis]
MTSSYLSFSLPDELFTVITRLSQLSGKLVKIAKTNTSSSNLIPTDSVTSQLEGGEVGGGEGGEGELGGDWVLELIVFLLCWVADSVMSQLEGREDGGDGLGEGGEGEVDEDGISELIVFLLYWMDLFLQGTNCLLSSDPSFGGNNFSILCLVIPPFLLTRHHHQTPPPHTTATRRHPSRRSLDPSKSEIVDGLTIGDNLDRGVKGDVELGERLRLFSEFVRSVLPGAVGGNYRM